jgi:hypothetical protein
MTTLFEITRQSTPSAAVCTASIVAGAPGTVVAAIGALALLLYYAWRVFERPDLLERWLDLRDRRRERRSAQ